MGSRSFCPVGLLRPEPSVAASLPPPVLGALSPCSQGPQLGPAPLGLQAVPLAPPRTAGRRAPACAHHTPAVLAAPPRPSCPRCPVAAALGFSLVSSRSGPLLRCTLTLRPDTPLVRCYIALGRERGTDHHHGLQPPRRPRGPGREFRQGQPHAASAVPCPLPKPLGPADITRRRGAPAGEALLLQA